MKKVILFLIFERVVLGNDLSVAQIEDMVSKIQKQREGVQLETLQGTKEPFVRLQQQFGSKEKAFIVPEDNQEEVDLHLNAIMNQTAFINNEWVMVGEHISGYELKYIGKKGVVLRKENSVRTLFLASIKKESLFKITERKK